MCLMQIMVFLLPNCSIFIFLYSLGNTLDDWVFKMGEEDAHSDA